MLDFVKNFIKAGLVKLALRTASIVMTAAVMSTYDYFASLGFAKTTFKQGFRYYSVYLVGNCRCSGNCIGSIQTWSEWIAP